jgi:acyl-CoA thioesterase FadM
MIIDGWLDRVERVRFWCAFRITRASDEALVAECRQTLAIIEMPAARLVPLPENWDKYRAA